MKSTNDGQWQADFGEACGMIGLAGEAMSRAARASGNARIAALVKEISKLSAKCAAVKQRANKRVHESTITIEVID